jgi:hypothetical protein
MEEIMSFSIEKYKKDIEVLVNEGNRLQYSMYKDCLPEEFKKQFKDKFEYDEFIKKLPNFINEYQTWYSAAKVLVKQILPDRLDDFVRYYEKPKARKSVSFENYRIEDYLQGLVIRQGGEIITNTSSAITHFQQQLAIVKALQQRFESSLYDIRLHLQAEMFDDELDAATYLLNNIFVRAAGAMAGVVLERHLKQVCANHIVALGKKKNLTISDLNDALKNSNTIETTEWRRIQLLGDIRNKCDHHNITEPTITEVTELIEGVKKVIKTLF